MKKTIAMMMAAAMAASVMGATLYWVPAGGSGVLDDPANWNLAKNGNDPSGRVPDAGDEAVFANMEGVTEFLSTMGGLEVLDVFIPVRDADSANLLETRVHKFFDMAGKTFAFRNFRVRGYSGATLTNGTFLGSSFGLGQHNNSSTGTKYMIDNALTLGTAGR